jgi:hypothetical protein
MQGYDWGFGFGFGRRHPARPGGYDAEMRMRGYDRGMRGGSRGRGVPGGRERGLYYGGAPPWGRGGQGWDRPGATYPRGGGWSGTRGGYGREMEPRGGRGGYDRAYADEPFLPESAYRRHPELAQEPRHRLDRWPGGGHGAGTLQVLDDDELEQAVRQSLYQDNWIDADAIEVEAVGGIVTLRGEVDDFLQARYAWDDAWETEGVRGVINQLTVRTDQPSEPVPAGHQATEE